MLKKHTRGYGELGDEGTSLQSLKLSSKLVIYEREGSHIFILLREEIEWEEKTRERGLKIVQF